MFGLFKRKQTFDDVKKTQFVDSISSMLEMQITVSGGCSIEDNEGHLNRKAIGYIYGFIDAALCSIGQDMSNVSVGIPITYHVLNRLFSGRGEDYIEFLRNNIGKDEVLMFGVMTGGQQYIESIKPGHKGVPMKFGIFLVEGDKQ